MKRLLLICLFSVGFGAQASLIQRGHLVGASCTSNGQFFKEDSCRSLKISSPSCQVQLNGRQISVTFFNQRYSGVVAQPYVRVLDKVSYEKSEINGLGGLLGGNVTLNLNSSAQVISVRHVDIYNNKDRAGLHYDRYRCILNR